MDSNPLTPLFEIDPLVDERWPSFIQGNSGSSIFHTREWLRALSLTFNYKPVAVTLSHPGQSLQNAWPFCRIRSWITGNRLVALPFADHCEPLGTEDEVSRLLDRLPHWFAKQEVKYVEIRPARALTPENFNKAATFHLHTLNLRRDLNEIFRSFNKSSTQRMIRRSERLTIQISEGCSEWHLRTFYELFVLTRRRFSAPPQPIEWFQNLISCLGPKISISIASKDDTPIAGMVTLHHKNVVTYKYGASDARHHSSGGVFALFWNTIVQAKSAGALEFDLGRTDLDNAGLTNFKNHWGTTQSPLIYWRYGKRRSESRAKHIVGSTAKKCIARLPESMFVGAGRLLYRHIG